MLPQEDKIKLRQEQTPYVTERKLNVNTNNQHASGKILSI